MAAPGVFGLAGAAAKNDYIVGALAATVAVVATAEPARLLRFLNLALGAWMTVAAWLLNDTAAWSDVLSGLLLILFSIRCGRVDDRYGSWDRWVR